jgi:prepilin-type N-terminal cleavage/methylation domain-containing protein
MSMIKKLLKNKKGFTLMELVVGMVIFAIISVAVSASLAPTLFAFMRANDFAEYNILMDSIANQIINDLAQSTEPPDFDDEAGDWPEGWNNVLITKSASRVRYTIEATAANRGMLVIETGGNASLVFPEEFYKRKTVAFKLEALDTDPDDPIVAYNLTVRMESLNGDFLVERVYAVRPLILNQHHPSQAEEGD